MVVAPERMVMSNYRAFESTMFDVTYCCILIIQVLAEGATASSALKSWKLNSSSSSGVLRFSANLERIRSLEQQVRAMKGHVDVAKSKAKAAADGEAFILESVKNMNKDLEGKNLPFLFFIVLEFSLF